LLYQDNFNPDQIARLISSSDETLLYRRRMRIIRESSGVSTFGCNFAQRRCGQNPPMTHESHGARGFTFKSRNFEKNWLSGLPLAPLCLTEQEVDNSET